MKSPDQPRSRRGTGTWMEAAGRKRFGGRQSRRPARIAGEACTSDNHHGDPTSPTTVQPTAMITGTDGNIWFLEEGANAIGEINPVTHVMHSYSNGLPASAILSGITSRRTATSFLPRLRRPPTRSECSTRPTLAKASRTSALPQACTRIQARRGSRLPTVTSGSRSPRATRSASSIRPPVRSRVFRTHSDGDAVVADGSGA